MDPPRRNLLIQPAFPVFSEGAQPDVILGFGELLKLIVATTSLSGVDMGPSGANNLPANGFQGHQKADTNHFPEAAPSLQEWRQLRRRNQSCPSPRYR